MTFSQMKQLVRSSALSALVLGACAVEPTATEIATSPVTIHDTDLAPECAGILTYVNNSMVATLQELDSYLPSNVASAIVQRRAVQAFADLADLSSVSGVAQARLDQIASRARTLGFIGPSCAGVYEELAVSSDDRAAILAYANTATFAELWDVIRSEADSVTPLLISRRPFTTLQYLVDTSGVGPSTFRSLRDAAVFDPFDDLVDRVNDVDRDVVLKTAFNWYAVAYEQPGQQSGMVCFGVPADLVSTLGGVMRPTLADGAEVMSAVASAASYANRYNEVGNTSIGLAHLSAQVTGGTFFGCYLDYEPNPWCGVNRAFFVNQDTGYRVFTEISWCE